MQPCQHTTARATGPICGRLDGHLEFRADHHVEHPEPLQTDQQIGSIVTVHLVASGLADFEHPQDCEATRPQPRTLKSGAAPRLVEKTRHSRRSARGLIDSSGLPVMTRFSMLLHVAGE